MAMPLRFTIQNFRDTVYKSNNHSKCMIKKWTVLLLFEVK